MPCGECKLRVGIDIGSTTIKCVMLDKNNVIKYKSYERHLTKINEMVRRMLVTLQEEAGDFARVSISGSAGMGLAKALGIPFVQEVFATKLAIEKFIPSEDVAIELGGEDAKILFLTGGSEVRMNGTCAGGTGSFIDQMATLMNMSAGDLNELAKAATKSYTIASRCGVFAKTDVQPLLNQGAKKSDVSKSILGAVVNQTLGGLAQGRQVKGNVVYLGGPLTFMGELRNSFDEALGVTGIFPQNSLYFVSVGTALSCEGTHNIKELIEKLDSLAPSSEYEHSNPLFKGQTEYQEFLSRHNSHDVPEVKNFSGDAFLGIDSGSTTVKVAIITRDGDFIASMYKPNKGNPVKIVKDFLSNFLAENPNVKIVGSASTGYGEELMKQAFDLGHGVVETVAHTTAARHFMPDVEYIIDIGGQDIKCIKIRNGIVDNIFLNEACSSGCGSFLQTFAQAAGYSIEEFAKLGLFANRPVSLGTRCTVFMNSSVKQAQKDGASIENIAAGLCVSVVKNALYKVIRASNPSELGNKIVVQGGTFLNDAVLRCFEQEMGTQVIRPTISGIMGAYGAALYATAKPMCDKNLGATLENLTQEVKESRCKLCTNNCAITINTFDGTRRFISGNKCERPTKKKTQAQGKNLYAEKLKLLQSYKPIGNGKKIGLPLALNLYEMLPFWHTFFTDLGFCVVSSGISDNETFTLGHSSIPSDTVCYPAKLVHGHVKKLISMGVDGIFYPCLTYNFDEGISDNRYNCPVVAYYPEVIEANMSEVSELIFIKDHIGLHQRRTLPAKLAEILGTHFEGITLRNVKRALKKAYAEHEAHMKKIAEIGSEILREAEDNDLPVIVLAGRPYHTDPQVNHGVDVLIASYGFSVVSEDAVSAHVQKFKTAVLNQWTYHARMYAAAKYIADKKNMNLVQIISFGCGLDAVTSDEMRELLEENEKIYTGLKMDEITNSGAVKIRLRSLFETI